jgi:isoleucyl-tRNA synthetase
LVSELAKALDDYDFPSACNRVLTYIDALNNWYIRRSRPRFWRSERDQSKSDAYDTLYTVLTMVCRAISPMLPLISEKIHQGLTGQASVHLTDWPTELDGCADAKLVAEMDRVRDVCSAALSLRAAENIRVRQPLAELVIAGSQIAGLEPYLDLIADEVNVKHVRLSDEIDAYATFRLQVNARAIGPRLGGETKNVIKASKLGEWTALPDGGVSVAGHSLAEGEFDLLLKPKAGVTCESLSSNDAIAVLDLTMTDALVAEGLARDVVRAVQQARKEADLDVSDSIRLVLGLEQSWRRAIDPFRGYIAEQTLATEVDLDGDPGAKGLFAHEASFGDANVRVGLVRTSREKL